MPYRFFWVVPFPPRFMMPEFTCGDRCECGGTNTKLFVRCPGTRLSRKSGCPANSGITLKTVNDNSAEWRSKNKKEQ